MSGGDGADAFQFILAENSGADTITDFESGSDALQLQEGLSITDQQQVDANGDGTTDLRVTLSTGGTVDLLGVAALGTSDVVFFQ